MTIAKIRKTPTKASGVHKTSLESRRVTGLAVINNGNGGFPRSGVGTSNRNHFGTKKDMNDSLASLSLSEKDFIR